MALAANGTRTPVPSQREQAAGKQTPLGIEERVNELIERIRPNKASDTRRQIVSDYVKGLIRRCFLPEEEVEAFMFGSVPLKTYLPDGDIDLAMFQETGTKLRDSWTTDLKAFLETKTAKAAPQYRIRDVQIINAEVKLLKCLVDNIVVDISFDMLGGISTVCFLESIDRFIRKEHLFKRSIILVKAWCYYESRLLGAHHSLLSTYALETMVLYIFNMYCKELSSPLKVLRKFLDVFSSFDWDNQALSLQGPIPLSAFDDPKEEPRAEVRGDVLLREEILGGLLNMYRPRKELAPVTKAFIRRFNIVDPLLPTNNLGKSINIASKYRIREALTHGSRVLASIFAKAGQEALDAVDAFFETTWGAQSPPASQPADEGPALQPAMLPASVPLGAPHHLGRQGSQDAHALAAHAAMGSYALAAAQNGGLHALNGAPGPQHLHTKSALHSRRNSSDEMENRHHLSRTYSGPLPDRPRSSASNASTSSDTHPNTPPYGASMSRRAGAEAWARFQQGRPGSLLGPQSAAPDASGTVMPVWHDSRLHKGHMEHASSNGAVMTPNGHIMSPYMPFHGPGTPYHMAMMASHAELLRYHNVSSAAGQYAGPPVSMANGHMYPPQQAMMYHMPYPGTAPPVSHQHQNGTPASRSEPAKEKRSPVSSTAREAKEDLLAGDLELLSGHLEKAKRCHKHVISAAVASAAPAQQQPKPPAPQQAKQPPNGASLSQPMTSPAPRPAASQASAGSQRTNASQPPVQQGQALQQSQAPSLAGQVPSYKAAATNRLPPRSASIDSVGARRMHQQPVASASAVPTAPVAAVPASSQQAAVQPQQQSAAQEFSATTPTTLPAPPAPINILRQPEAAPRHPEAAVDPMSAQNLPPGPPLNPSSAGTVRLGQPLASVDSIEAASMPGSSRGSAARSLQAVSQSEMGSPAPSQPASTTPPPGSRAPADAVIRSAQEDSSSSGDMQQPPRPPALQPMGHYQNAVLGLGRPHPKSPQPAPAPAPPPAVMQARTRQAAGAPAAQQSSQARDQHAARPDEATQLPRVPAAEQKPSAAQTSKAKPAAAQLFTLTDGDFPTLGVAGPTDRRRSSKGDASPASSSAAAAPKVPEPRLPLPVSPSPAAVPRWGPAAKTRQAAEQSPGSSPAVNSVDTPDAKAAIQLLPTLPNRAAVSRSEGSSPTAAAGQKGSAWTGRISHAVLTGPTKVSQSHVSPSGRSSIASRPSSAHGSSQSARG